MAEIIDSECVVSSVRTYESILMAYTSEKSAMKEMEKAKKEAEEKRSKAAAQHERELQQIKQRKQNEANKAAERKQAEIDARRKRQEADQKAEQENTRKQLLQDTKANAQSQQMALQEKLLGNRHRLEQYTRDIEDQNKEVASLQQESKDIRESYSYDFGDTAAGVTGRVFAGFFTLGGAEAYSKSSRSECYYKMEGIAKVIAVHEKEIDRLEKLRDDI